MCPNWSGGKRVKGGSLGGDERRGSAPWGDRNALGTVTLKGKYDDYNQWNLGSGHGWAGAYNVLWNSTVDEIKVESPPGAYNWVIGCKGLRLSRDLGAPIINLPVSPSSQPACIRSKAKSAWP
jgi:hypothetical protein